MRRALLIPMAVLAFVLAAAACSRGADEPKEGLEVGDKFPHYDTFAAATIDGKDIKLTDYKGKLLFVDFWASWCGPCRTELPYLVIVQNTYVGDQFAIVGISLDQQISQLRAMADELGMKYPQICDEKGWQSRYAKMFDVSAIPTNFLLDASGVILAKDMRGLSVAGHVAKALGRDEPVVHYAEAMDYLTSTEKPDLQKALEMVTKAIEADPEEPQFHFLAAQINAEAGNSAAAIEHFVTGLEHADSLPVFMPALFAYYSLGQLYFAGGDSQKAIETIDKAIAAINALDEGQKSTYDRYVPELEKVKAQWTGATH
jgi:thiol-disulfide isomerase/thioredoxin